MKRNLKTAALLFVVALLASACNSSSLPSTAATVNGSSIPSSELVASLRSVETDPGFLCMSGLSGGNAPSGAWSSSLTAATLNELVRYRLVNQLLAHDGVKPAPASDASNARTEAAAVFSDDVAFRLQEDRTRCQGTGSSILDSLGATFRSAVLSDQEDVDAISLNLAHAGFAPGALSAWEHAHATQSTLLCVSVVDLTSKKLAGQVATAVRNGASFAAEADRYSSDFAGKGGSIGCLLDASLENYASVVAHLKNGQISAPTAYQTSWILFTVTSRHFEPTSVVIPQIVEAEQPAFNRQYSALLSSARVWVAPTYGTYRRQSSSGLIDTQIAPVASNACGVAPDPAAAGCPPPSTASTTTTLAVGDG